MAMAVASRKSLKMNSEEKHPSSGDEVSAEGASGDLRTFGRYIIEKKLGEGGMGAVYRAVDSNLKRTVALKVLPRDKAKNDILVKRFQAEAQAAAQLRHKNIVCVYDSGELDGYLYIAMEYVDGIDVQDLVMRKGGLSVKRSLDIIKQVARALEHAHGQTIVHRDIKPANLLIDREGNVKLADMGLARSIAETEEAGITRAGTTVGTVDYMSPEQARDSKSADCRSDMYSLGATWYHMLAGRPLFPHGDLLNKITAHATQPPPDPRDIRPNVPESVVRIMHRMLEKKPDRRYQTPTDLLHDLEHGFSGEDSGGTDSESKSSREGVLSFDILAGLAEEETAADAEIRSRKSSARSDRGSHRSDGEFPKSTMPETAILSVQAGGSSATVDAPAKPRRKKPKTKKGTKGRKSSPAISKKSPSSSETLSDTSTTSSAIPSRREVMLARNVRHRRAAESRRQMTIFGVSAAGILIIGYMIISAMSGSPAPEPNVPDDVKPPAAPATSGPSTPAGNSTAPVRQPPRRVE